MISVYMWNLRGNRLLRVFPELRNGDVWLIVRHTICASLLLVPLCRTWLLFVPEPAANGPHNPMNRSYPDHCNQLLHDLLLANAPLLERHMILEMTRQVKMAIMN